MRILLGRTYLGFGDWVMFTSLVKMFNKYRPDIEIDLVNYRCVPMRWLQLPFECGARLRLVDCDVDRSRYDAVVKHVVYDSVQPKGEHLLEAMLRVVNKACGTNVPLDWGCSCIPVHREEVLLPDGPYCLMPSAGAPTPASAPKHFPFFPELCQIVSKELMQVVQIGTKGDPDLPGAVMRYDDLHFGKMSYLFTNSATGVFLENGLMHWAGNHQSPCYVLFISGSHAFPEHVRYPNQIPILARGLFAEEVYQKMCENPPPDTAVKP